MTVRSLAIAQKLSTCLRGGKFQPPSFSSLKSLINHTVLAVLVIIALHRSVIC